MAAGGAVGWAAYGSESLHLAGELSLQSVSLSEGVQGSFGKRVCCEGALIWVCSITLEIQ